MIAIVDYGLGNIKAFANVFKRLNIECYFAATEEELRRASKIILPGVGAFDHAMSMLNNSGLRACLDELVLERKIPVIGICVGMQMMADSSEEGASAGLGWIPGTVRKFTLPASANLTHFPLPHMGWNNIVPSRESALLDCLDEEKRFYFLHSYYYQCVNESDVVAIATYGADYACIINRDNVYGIQCHPEKSHHNGVALLKSFANL
ncbi:imidazole glycerol phosphate synthase subunit HisH [Shewanella colwelliana]|uniref:imidazole glycerol phosphate synthase subunit HisH n=1 Tax=Shewanella colwelliana TaxID=23 RepID=UPI0022AE5BEF|nr:imidazole glycerol phosphate synthase subunit HisH [Shewanella colwelliana]MCZ4336711.1 imidazole glycerol phosphate synthase subunit HisH [Shewanella colwelliana]